MKQLLAPLIWGSFIAVVFALLLMGVLVAHAVV